MKVKLLLTFALLLTAVTGAWADDSGSCGTDVSYSYEESTHTLTISGTGAMADYPNPSERPWDSYATEIETVIIEDGVTSIGDCAFDYCEGLTSVAIPASVTSIGVGVFYGCLGLTSVTIGSGVTSIGYDAFRSCSSLTSVTIPASVTSISVGAFANCSNLATMTVEAGNTVYDSRNSCNAIIEKESNTLIIGCNGSTIPGDVTSIGENSFLGCDGLTTITIPASVTSIGDYAFDGCSNLATMTVETGNTVYDSRNGCNAIIEKESNTMIFGCKNTKIPDDVTSIGDDAFQGCVGLTSVTIPDGVTSIGIYAFESCTGMTTVTIGSGVTYIGRDAFFNCTKVEVVYCNADPEKLEWEEDGCDDFKYNGSTIIKVADAAPWIAKFTDVVNGTFSDKPYVPLTWNYDAGTKTLTFSGTMIPSYNDPDERPWIAYVAEVENIVIEDDVTSIGNYAFYDCTGMTTVTIGSGVTYIGYDAFYDCKNVEVVYCNADPTKLTWDESGCDDFKPDGTTIINVADAAPWYTKFGSVVHGIFRDPSTVPFSWNYDAGTKTLTFSGTEAIPSCNDSDKRPWIDYVSEVENIVINEGVRGIGKYAFYDCIGLTTVTIPASLTSIGYAAFAGCSNLATMMVDAGNTKYDSRNGCNAIIEKETNTLIVGCKNTKIPDDVTNIGDNAFEGCISLTTVTIPAGVTRIGKRAFEGCGGLTTVTIGSGVTYIGSDAFFNCKNVEVVYCNADPEKLEWDENGCDDFKYDGSTIIQVADAAPWIAKFTGKVNGIFSDKPYVPLTWNYDAATKTLTFSGTAIPSYNDPDERPWIAYVAEVEKIVIEDGVTSIGHNAFGYCASLTTVTIPASVTSIGSSAFSDCSGLTSVTIPSSVTSIGDYAFYYCTGLTSIEIPAGVTTIGEAAFQECSDLATVTFATGSKLETIDDAAFASTGLTSIEIPASVTTIDDFAFQECSDLATVTFASGAKLETIGIEVFGSCKSLNSVTIPASVTSIGTNAFISCTGLTTVTFDSGSKLETIGEAAFDGTGLTSINIPASVTSIGDYAFDGCSNLVTMTVEADNTVYDSRNGCNAIIEKKSNTLIAGCNSSFIPDDVTAIGDGAFFYCTGLTTVTIPASVTNIGMNAFQGCTGLTTVTIGSGVTYIGDDAFYLCTNVTDVYCYADPDALTWNESGCNDFKDGKATKCHVTDADPWSAFTDVNVDFVGDLAPEAETKVAGEEYWSSYYNSAAHLKADNNTTVYKATLSGTTVTLTEITDKVITAGQAVLLKKTTAEPVELTPCAAGSEDDYSDNDLEGVDAETAKESGSDYYVLSYQASKLSFYKYSGATLGANKAFFKIPANSSREFLDILGEVTGIDGRYKMEDGRSDVYYDLNGRRVMNPTKGIYIVNGSKVVVK
ncbi:leucine-rich repeat domain-containing protein [Prevotella sp. tf2-5]|uniref:leucine-rich repeat domain-containing protein n=1 Tax=Prevotella sp. tf2-5 TaxID=1761889 RepID=UPI0008EC0D44|nr:leucine-rich repeat domain-containing protein [Prevotella sp. tf2-5]SFO46276.1 Leucine rich repeat-containing protein [Prevotella sp. tf2-5]